MNEQYAKTETAPVTPQRKLVRVGITPGDTNGVGYEVILKTFADSPMLELCTPVVFGNSKTADIHRKELHLNTSFSVVASAAEARDGQLNLVNCSTADVAVDFGQPSEEAGREAFLSLEAAVAAYKQGDIDVIVTAPINKANIQSGDFHFVGHTEYLHDRLGEEGGAPLMILFNDLMRVALVTTHLPVADVPSAITQEKVEATAERFYLSLRKDFNVSAPRIAVLSLNPHAGDGGLLGSEENDVIAPAVKSLADKGMACYGPYAADGFFGAAQYRHFDGVLAMYHDQGLAAFKALTDGNGVNFTANLPVVRTSPDHGTAYDIAGKGVAAPDSFRQAIYSAIDIFRNRAAYVESHANPLPKIYQERKER